MIVRLPPELESALRANPEPLHVVGADGTTEYVIITAEHYKALRGFLAPFQKAWNDPVMDAYDYYDENLKKLQQPESIAGS